MSLPKNPILKILVVDDDASIRTLLESRFTRKGHQVTTAENVSDARKKIESSELSFDVIVTDLRMPGESGFEILSFAKVPVIIITGHGDKESAIEAVEKGAFGFFEKPFDLDALEFSVRRAFEKSQLEHERLELLEELGRICTLQSREIESLESPIPKEIMGKAQVIQPVKEMVEKLSKKSTATVLILGESGTGKEVLARELHFKTHPQSLTNENYDRSPFVAINCSAIPADLLESELYGHEKGAFSGAANSKIGLAEVAREGTLFLDEIGDMELKHQAKLLRLLQERTFRRVGGTKDLVFKGRIMAATHRKLEQRIAEGLFREDLFYRLSIVTVTCPALRLRGEDIFEIADRICKKFGLKGIAPERLAELRTYSWPGNIRELHNWIERASILGLTDRDGFVNCEIPGVEKPAFQTYSNSQSQTHAEFQTLKKGETIKDARARVLEALDKNLIERALERSSGNLSEAARILGLDRKNLGRRISELGLKKAS